MNNSKNPDQWKDRVSKSISKNDLPKDVWERILKIRNSPIKLIENGKREINPSWQKVRKQVFDYDFLATRREGVRKVFDCYAP